MDNRILAGLLAAVPPVDLRIIELTAELTTSRRLPRPGRRGRPAAGGGTGLRPGAGLRIRHGADVGGAAMATAAPPRLSGLAGLLLRRPPSLRELVTLVGYADDYAWFAGLVRRLFPDEAEAALAAPDVRQRVVRFAELFQERHFPLYAPYFEFQLDDGDEPPWTWLRRGIPFELMGFGYDGLHEMWDGYREGLSAMALLVKAPRRLLRRPRRAAGGMVGIGRRPHPATDPAQSPRRRHTPGRPYRGAEGDRVRGGSASLLLGLWRDRQLLPGPIPTRTGRTTGSPTPGRTTSSRRAQRSGARPAPSWTR